MVVGISTTLDPVAVRVHQTAFRHFATSCWLESALVLVEFFHAWCKRNSATRLNIWGSYLGEAALSTPTTEPLVQILLSGERDVNKSFFQLVN